MAKKTTRKPTQALVGLVMGSISDWDVVKNCADKLEELGIPYEKRVLSAHRTPEQFREYFSTACDRGIKVIIGAAGGAAHLPGVAASHTELPVIGIPIQSQALNGIDSLLSIVQMPAGIPVPTMAIGKPGAINAALCAASILALSSKPIHKKLIEFREKQAEKVLSVKFPE